MSGTVGSRPESISIFNRFSFNFDGTDENNRVLDTP